MNKILYVLAILGAGLAAPSAVMAHDIALVPHEAEYRVKISVAKGTLTSRVQATDDGFVARSEIKPKGFASLLMNGSIVEQSTFAVTTDGVRPQHFESVDTLTKDQKNVTMDFDWQDGNVSGTVGDADFSFALDGMVHDRVSIQYELMLQLINGKSGKEYVLLDGDELKVLTVKSIGTKQLDVPFGEFEALGIAPSKLNSSRVTTLWLAPELGYLPVIIEQRRKGKVRVRAVLSDYRRLTTDPDFVVNEMDRADSERTPDAADGEMAFHDEELAAVE